MDEAGGRPRGLGAALEVWVPLLVLGLDQLTKELVRRTLALHASTTVIPGLLDFTHVRNTGAAFGILERRRLPLQDGPDRHDCERGADWGRHILGEPVQPSARRADRPCPDRRRGGGQPHRQDVRPAHVVDFVDVYWRDYHFWAFNVADSAITIGVAIMILDMLGVGAHVSKTA